MKIISLTVSGAGGSGKTFAVTQIVPALEAAGFRIFVNHEGFSHPIGEFCGWLSKIKDDERCIIITETH